MIYSKKSQYTDVETRVIYALASPFARTFSWSLSEGYVEKSLSATLSWAPLSNRKNLQRDERKNLRPGLFVLEEIDATKVGAYNHVVVWIKLLLKAGFNVLNNGEILSYSEDLLEKNIKLYEERKLWFKKTFLILDQHCYQTRANICSKQCTVVPTCAKFISSCFGRSL